MPFIKGHKFYRGGEKGWFKKGTPSPFKGGNLSKEHIEKLRIAKLKNPVRYWLGKKRSPETVEKIRIKNTGKKKKSSVKKVEFTCPVCQTKLLLLPCHIRNKETCSKSCAFKGDRNPNWKNGITPEIIKIRNSSEYRRWCREVFERDNYTCTWCNARNGNGKSIHLEAHHIKPFAYFPESRFDISNGITLCRPCHDLTKWGRSTQELYKKGEKYDSPRSKGRK